MTIRKRSNKNGKRQQKSTNNSNIEMNRSKLKNQEIIDKVKNIMRYIDEEKNKLPYNLALQHDKRTYCQYYISLLKTKHNAISAFFNNTDYNYQIIKKDIFFINFSLFYTVNALFYDDDAIHTIYETGGSFDLEHKLPKIIYSSLISMVLNLILNSLAMTNSNIIDFKQNKSKIDINKRKMDLENKLCVKFVLYFIISFIFLLFFWYYISMFGVIYKNTQYHLLKDTLISYGLSLFYPFVINLLPGLFRIPSLSNTKNKREGLYKFSKILQMF